MSSIVKKNEENAVMKKVANAKTNKEQKKINKVSCPCAIMNLTPKKGLEYFLKGVPVFTMKKSYVNWNLDTVEDEIILNQLTKLSKGKLSVPEGTELSKFTPNPKHQNPHVRKKKKNNRNNRNQHRN